MITPASQWASLCPHLGAADKTLLQVLFALTTETEPVCVIAPADLRAVIYSSPVDVGQDPNVISSSGLLRLLRKLSGLGQITRPEGSALTFSSKEATLQRSIPIHVHQRPQHECESDRMALLFTRAQRSTPQNPAWT